MGESNLRVIIVDDESLARQVLREHLTVRGDVEIIAECANGFEAVKAISELQPDLILLDVQMPKLDGFEVLELVGRSVPVVFCTAYDEFAVRAFEVHAVDYLLKPFSEERVGQAIERAKGLLMAREGLSEQDAFARLRRASQVSGRPLKVVAEAVVATLEPT